VIHLFLSFYPLLFLASCHFGYLGSGCSTSTTLITGCTGKYCCFNRKAPFPSYCNPCCSHFLCSPKKGRKSFGLDRGSKSCELWPSGQVEIESTTCNARPLSLLSDPGPCAPKGGVPPSSAQQRVRNVKQRRWFFLIPNALLAAYTYTFSSFIP
jgi:hypothetical protein